MFISRSDLGYAGEVAGSENRKAVLLELTWFPSAPPMVATALCCVSHMLMFFIWVDTLRPSLIFFVVLLELQK